MKTGIKMAKLTKFAKHFPFNQKLSLKNKPNNGSKEPIVRGVSPIIQVAHALIWEVLRRDLTYQRLFRQKSYKEIDNTFGTALTGIPTSKPFDPRYSFNEAARNPLFGRYLHLFLPIPCRLNQAAVNAAIEPVINPHCNKRQVLLYLVQGLESGFISFEDIETVCRRTDHLLEGNSAPVGRSDSLFDLYIKCCKNNLDLFKIADFGPLTLNRTFLEINRLDSKSRLRPQPEIITDIERFLRRLRAINSPMERMASLFPATEDSEYSEIKHELFSPRSLKMWRASEVLQRNVVKNRVFDNSFKIWSVPGLQESDAHAFFDLYGKAIYNILRNYLDKKAKTISGDINRNFRRILEYGLNEFALKPIASLKGKTSYRKATIISIVKFDSSTIEVRTNPAGKPPTTVYSLYIQDSQEAKKPVISMKEHLSHVISLNVDSAAGFRIDEYCPMEWKMTP
jgi:hypothetical protein